MMLDEEKNEAAAAEPQCAEGAAATADASRTQHEAVYYPLNWDLSAR